MVILDRSPATDIRVPARPSRRPRPWAPDRGGALLLVTVALGAVVGWWIGGRAAHGLSAGDHVVRLALTVVALAGVAAAALVSTRLRTVADAATLEDGVGVPLVAHLEAPLDLTVLPTLDAGSAGAASFDPLLSAVARQIGLPRPLLVVAAGPAGPGTRPEATELPVWVGANLAIGLAGAGRRVLLVDARLDARHEAGSDVAMPGGSGFAGVLAGASLAETSTAGPVSGLTVLPPGRRRDLPAVVCDETGGRALGDAADLLVPSVTRRLVEAASEHDVVVVLAPALRTSRPGDGPTRSATEPSGRGLLVLAVPEHQARVGALRDRVAAVRQGGTRVLGAVLVGGGPRR